MAESQSEHTERVLRETEEISRELRAQLDIAVEALEEIADQDTIEIVEDPHWPKRIAWNALRRIRQRGNG